MISALLLKMATVKCHGGSDRIRSVDRGKRKKVLSSHCICYHPQNSRAEAGTPVYLVHFLCPLGPNMRVNEGELLVRRFIINCFFSQFFYCVLS